MAYVLPFHQTGDGLKRDILHRRGPAQVRKHQSFPDSQGAKNSFNSPGGPKRMAGIGFGRRGRWNSCAKNPVDSPAFCTVVVGCACTVQIDIGNVAGVIPAMRIAASIASLLPMPSGDEAVW